MTEKRVFEGRLDDYGVMWVENFIKEWCSMTHGLWGQKVKVTIEPLPVAPQPAAPTPELEELTIDEIKGILLWTHDNYGREEIVLLNTDNGSSTNLADELGGYEGCLIDVHAYYSPEPKPAPGPGADDSNGGGA